MNDGGIDIMSHLFDTVELAGLELKNRIVMAPMTRSFSPGGVPHKGVVDYYRKRAEVGLIITEGTVINHPGANGYKDVPRFYGEGLEGWRQVVEAVHGAGGKIFPQLWHVGNVRKLGQEPDPQVPAYGPMGLEKEGKQLIRAMTKDDITQVVEAYGEAAAAAKDIGFDGVEIHGAHGYLIDQFLFEGINKRADEYGGSLEKRCRLAREVVAEVRQRVGPDYPICFRFSQWKMKDYDAKIAKTPQELEAILKILNEAGVDIFHCSTRRFWLPEFEGSDLNLAGWTKKLSGKPTITVGSVGLDQDFMTTFRPDAGDSSMMENLNLLEGPLSRGEYDLVAVGRPLIANPDWVSKVQNGEFSQIKVYAKEQLATLD